MSASRDFRQNAKRPSTMDASNIINVSYEKFAPRSSDQVSRLSRIATLSAGPIVIGKNRLQEDSDPKDSKGRSAPNFLLQSLLSDPLTSESDENGGFEEKVDAFNTNCDMVKDTILKAFTANDSCTTVYKHTSSLRLALRASMNIAEDISNRHTELIRHSSELSAAADRLQEEENMLSKHAEEIGRPLKHYDSVDDLGVSVGILFKGKNAVVRGLPKIKVDSEDFPKVLDAIGDAVIFFGRESGGKHALEQYEKDKNKKNAAGTNNENEPQFISGSIEYYRRAMILQEAALQLIKEAVVDRIQTTTEQVSNILNIPKSIIPADKLEATLIYTRFYGISKRSNSLLSLLKSRIHHGDAYTELLQLCKIKYCKNRETLLKNTVHGHIEKLKKQHGLVGMTRLASVFLIRLCTIENNLYLEFFGDSNINQEIAQKEPDSSKINKRKKKYNNDSAIYYDTLFQNYLTNLCNCMHRVIRKGLVSLTDLDILCQIISILREERTSASAVSVTLSAARAISNIIEDTQERLIFISNSTLTKEIIRFKPKKKDLDYPNKLIRKDDDKTDSSSGGSENDSSNNGQQKAAEDIEKQLLLVYESWYPPMRSVLKILSKIFRVVEPQIFEDIALQSVQACTRCLKDGALSIERNQGQIHSDLFLVKHLLILREQLSPFDIDLRSVERQLDFSETGAAVARFLANNNRKLFTINSNENALLTLLREGLSINETSIDSKRDLEDALRVACNDFIDHTIKDAVAVKLMQLYKKHGIMHKRQNIKQSNGNKTNNTNKVNISIEGNTLTLKEVKIAIIETMTGKDNTGGTKEDNINIEYLQNNFSAVSKQMGLYLDNPVTQNILLKPIIRKVLKITDDIRKYILSLQSMVLIDIQNNQNANGSEIYKGYDDSEEVKEVFACMKQFEKKIKSIKLNSSSPVTTAS